ncbi:unnamed protein product [Rotaria socialis]|uniref:Sulfotransferase domain-containing protein n=1 Tax=Rotaria socialis TaxID=392032 RepID=A0A818MNZ1_9BILA|nr:unnamed protein product [Rotaria socialis]CAF3393696.1 unnamed protein product [Rotaria socialis]CAF3396491.1 unnamed protein product [Rotaria socialis]CAF3592302.1 unnamed protein product [Rotaria socialis]CAF4469948.1 unnamed protein product [Rotaria socialis]
MTDQHLNFQMVDGIPIHIMWNPDSFSSALQYKARPDDIFIDTYPKSGTTWMEVILYSLLNGGKVFDDNMADFFARTPYLDVLGRKGMDNMYRPCTIKTHIPLSRIPYHENAKYICVVRNPKDVSVSFYQFFFNPLEFQGKQKDFDEFVEEFINGNVIYGSYFEHLRAVWQHKNDTNVFLTSYEEMIRDLPSVVRRLADFMNIELTDDLVERIVTYSSFNYMKERFDDTYEKQARIALADESVDAPWPMDKTSLEYIHYMRRVRQGGVGKWRSMMTDEQAERIDKSFAEKFPDMHEVQKLF